MRTHLPAFLAHVEAQRSPLTAKTYGRVVVALSEFLEPAAEPPSVAVVESFLSRPRSHGRRAAPATRNREIATLRVFFSWAERDLGWAENPAKEVRFEPEPPRDPAILDVPEELRLFTAADHETDRFFRARSTAALGFLTQLVLRVSELAALDLSQLDLDRHVLRDVRRKRDARQSFPVSPELCDLVRAWLPIRSLFALPGETALLVGKHGNRMSVRAVERMVAGLAKKAGIERRVYPHLLRHSGITDLVTEHGDLDAAGRLAGHSSLNTTRIYTHLRSKRVAAAVAARVVAIPTEVLRHAREAVGTIMLVQVRDGHALSGEAANDVEKLVDGEHHFCDSLARRVLMIRGARTGRTVEHEDASTRGGGVRDLRRVPRLRAGVLVEEPGRLRARVLVQRRLRRWALVPQVGRQQRLRS